ncbi:MAG: orotate phosphoribosyltransferase [Bacteroidia bacterium]|jgi:orotate phosphoribosyltransferase
MNGESNTSVKLAEFLLNIKAVKLQPSNPFKWSSGWNSPIYCDNRVTLSYPEIRTFIKNKMAAAVKSEFPNATALCGVATAGIAIGGLVADELEMPYSYCRPKPKEHGMKNQLEGRLDKNDKVVLVEDLISTGGSSLKVVEFLRENGYQVEGLISIFTYSFNIASENFAQANCKHYSLGGYNDLLTHAIQQGIITEAELPALNAWRQNPATWGV